MKKEFENRIGLVITPEEYAGIEQAYMGLPETVDKDKFVENWLHNGGIQDLFDKRQAAIISLKETAQGNYDEMMTYCRDFNKECERNKDLRAQIKALKDKLAAIGDMAIEVAA